MKRFILLKVVAFLIQATVCLGQSHYWLPTNGPGGPSINRLVTTDDGYLLAATSAGVYRTPVGSNIWTQASNGLDNSFVLDMAIHPNGKIFAVCYVNTPDAAGLYVSDDAGSSWSQVQTGISPWDPRHIGISRTGLIIVSGANVAYRSTDAGASWDVSDSSTMFYGSTLAVAFDSAGVPYIGSVWGVHFSLDQGENWLEAGSLNSAACAVAFNPSNVCFVGTWRNGVARLDAGGSWLQMGLEGNSALSIVIDRVGSIFIGRGGAGGVLQLKGEDSWVSPGSGLPSSYVWALAIDKDGYLYAGLDDGSVYRSTQPTTEVESRPSMVPDDFRLEQNYPNPFNPSTTIRYALPHRSHVTLTVYNMLGQEVATLVNAEVEAGHHETEFVARALASGVYFYRLTAGHFTETKRMILIR